MYTKQDLELAEAEYHKHLMSDKMHLPSSSHISMIRACLYLQDNNIEHEGYDQGLLLINNKVVYAPRTGKWRNLNKNKWYRSKSISSLISMIL